MTPRIDEIDNPVIGKYYLVPCIEVIPDRTTHLTCDSFTPVVSPLHDDEEYLDFPHDHWHFDFRFVSDKMWTRLTYLNHQYAIPNHHHVKVLHQWKLIELKEDSQVVSPHTVYRRKKMRREMSEFPSNSPFFKKFEFAYKDCELKDGLICPHKGVNLKGLPVRPDGNVICPAHGLMWNIKTKKMISRITHKEKV